MIIAAAIWRPGVMELYHVLSNILHIGNAFLGQWWNQYVSSYLHMVLSGEVSESMSNQWLESVARGTLHVYTEHILNIHELTEQSTKQLIMDIGRCWANCLSVSTAVIKRLMHSCLNMMQRKTSVSVVWKYRGWQLNLIDRIPSSPRLCT